MIRLSQKEIDALRWFAKEFPLGARHRYIAWDDLVEGLKRAAGANDEQDCDQIVAMLRDMGLLDARRMINRMFGGEGTTASGMQVLREVEARSHESAKPPDQPPLVFVSHSHHDYEIAKTIEQELAGRYGMKVFVAHQHLVPSVEWREEILRWLQDCDIFIALLTSKWPESDWTDQEAGIAIARETGAGEKVVLPIAIDVMPYGFLEKHQALRANPFEGRQRMRELVEAIAERYRLPFDLLIRGLETSPSYDDAGFGIGLLLSRGEVTLEQVNRVARAALAKDQVRNAGSAREGLRTFFAKHWDEMDANLRQGIENAFEVTGPEIPHPALPNPKELWCGRCSRYHTPPAHV